MDVPARQSLGVIWPALDGPGSYEAPGFTVFGLCPGAREIPVVELEVLADNPELEIRGPSLLNGEGWAVSVWDVRVEIWPSSDIFDDVVQRLLRGIVGAGYAVAWIGPDHLFAEPPFLFDPEIMAGGVLAAYSVGTGLISRLDLDQPLVPLSEGDLARLRTSSFGLVELSGADTAERESSAVPLRASETRPRELLDEADRRAAADRKVNGYRRLSPAHMAAIEGWIDATPMPYQVEGGAALGQFSNRMFGQALHNSDIRALRVAVSSISRLLSWPHDPRASDWKRLSLPAWVCAQIGIEWAPFVSGVLVDLAGRSPSDEASPTAVMLRFPEVQSQVDDLLGQSLLPSDGDRQWIPVWVDEQVEFARPWDDAVDRVDYFYRVATAQARTGGKWLRESSSPFDELGPWFENGKPEGVSLWSKRSRPSPETHHIVDDAAGRRRSAAPFGLTAHELERAYIRDLGAELAAGADDEVLARTLLVVTESVPQLMGVPFRAVHFWDASSAVTRIRSVARSLPEQYRSPVLSWLERPDAFSYVGDVVETSACGWLTFSPKWRPEAPWWAEVG